MWMVYVETCVQTLVKNSVAKLDNKRWFIKCKWNKSLNLMSVVKYSMYAWWIHTYNDHSVLKQNITMVRLLLNVHVYLEQAYPCCELKCIDNAVHILFVCNGINKIPWDKVKESFLRGIVMRMINVTLDD